MNKILNKISFYKSVLKFSALSLFAIVSIIGTTNVTFASVCVGDCVDVNIASGIVSALSPLTLIEGVDTNVVTKLQDIINATTTGVVISISTTTNTHIVIDGTVTYDATPETNSVTFSLTKNAEVSQRTISIIVPQTSAPNYTEIFSAITSTLDGQGIATNLNDCASTPTACGGLYFEKTGGFGGRVTFSAELDLTNEQTSAFLQALGSKFTADAGILGFDATTATLLKNAGAEIKMYGINNLGYTSDANPHLIVKDDEGNVIANTDENYPELSGFMFNGSTLTFNTSHFTQFQIDNNTYVDKSYEGETHDGSLAHPFTTIQAGIDATLSGGTTHVAAGTYGECLTIGKGITVTGADAATTIIDTASCVGSDQGVRITTNNVNLNNFTIKNTGDFDSNMDSVYVGTDGSISGLVLDHLIMNEGNNRRGVTVSNTSGELTNSNIQHFCSGVWISSSNGFVIDGNTISNNGVRSECLSDTGIDIINSNGAIIKNNIISNNDVGIYIDSSSYSTDVMNNKISGNNGYMESTGYGINNANGDDNVNARMNWWGNESGPSHSSNESGTGDNVSNGVAFSPWFGSEDFTSVRGFTSLDEETNSRYYTITENVNATTTEGFIMNISLGTTFTGSSTWNGHIDPPTVTTISNAPSRSGYTTTMRSIIEVGFASSKLSLNKSARLFFPGEAGKMIGYTRPGEGFTEITAVCGSDSQSWADSEGGLVTDGDCKIDIGNDLVVWTKHFTTFGTYTQTPIPAPTTSGGGGGWFVGGNIQTYFNPNTTTSGSGTTTATTGTSTPAGKVLGASAFIFLKDLRFGMNNNDVIELQKLLIKEGFLKISAPTGYFGPLTKSALIKYQAKNNLPSTGFFGPMTRAFINKLNTQ